MLLPDRLPAIPGVELAATYLPADGPEPCGDWYDAIPLPDGGIGVAMGDVVGRGASAIALAERMRDALHSFAQAGPGPGAVVRHVNSVVNDVESEMSTLIYAEFNPQSGVLRGANAGHLPALIRRAGGEIERWDAARSVPLAIDPDADYGEDRASLAPGDALLLFTDGLIERRGGSIGAGLGRIEAAVPGRGSADLIRTLVLDAMLGDQDHDDDVALLVLTLAPG